MSVRRGCLISFNKNLLTFFTLFNCLFVRSHTYLLVISTGSHLPHLIYPNYPVES